uniref:Synaptobrevin, longin-like domain protein n=1 Tax=Tanacetum cinerariifolium TaxID=118510 RepID=A0A699GX97_TANCI|nr:hypothetical protein [Tanacetum cinerariifolium]
MAPLTFVDTHNMVAFLSKSEASEEDVIRRDFRLDDANGVECLPNEKIFAKLARMGYEKPPPKLTFYKAFFSTKWKFLIHTLVQCLSAKRTAWNEFSCSMASAIICLATCRKFNFSKYIFDSMVKNVDSPSKFLMYPRFLQVVINNQVDDLISHNTRYTFLTLTQKVFSNMRRVGKGFSRVETPLFAIMMLQPQPQAVEEEVEMPNALATPSPITAPSLPPQDPTLTPHATPYALPPQAQPSSPYDSTMPLLNTLMETCASLSQKVAELEHDKQTQALEILKLKNRVKKLQKKKRSNHSGLKRLRNVGTSQRVESSNDTVIEKVVTMDVEPQRRIDQEEVSAATKDESVVEPTVFDDEEVTMTMAHTLIKLKAEKSKLLDEQLAQKLHDEEVEKAATKDKQEKDDLKRAQNMAGYKMEHFRGMTYDKVRTIFEREYKKVQTLFKPDKDVEEPMKKRVAKETLLQESFKKLKAVEVSGSVSTQETPSNDPKKCPKKMFKTYMLKGFDREDMVALWNLVKENFSTAVPNVDKKKALWVELKRLFEPDADDVLWKLQRYMHYPITWKMHNNCGVHQVSSTTKRHDMFMLTEKDYPLLNGVMTLMLSAKLQVKEDNEMARDLVMKIFMEANKLKSRRIKDYHNEKIDIRFRRECEDMIDEFKGQFNGMSIEINKKKELLHLEQVANLSTYSPQRFRSFYYDDDDDYEEKPEDSLIMGNEELSTIPEKELDEIIKSSVEDHIPIPKESEDTSDIECKDSYDSNLDESSFLVTPLFDSNEDEYFAPGDDVELLFHRDPSTSKMSVVSILKGIAPDYDDSRACGFVLRSLELQSLA